MKEHTPDPATLSEEQLMLEALPIIDLRLSEPEAFRILAAAARLVPEVTEYINWTATLDCDTLFNRKREAFKGMADFLDRKHPGCYAARKIRLEHTIAESIINNNSEEYDLLINQQQRICAKDKSKKEQALLLAMKLARLDHAITSAQVCDPLLYPEIWQLERDVLKLYPVPDDEDIAKMSSQDLADCICLYSILAGLKCNPQDDLTVRLMLDDIPDAFNNGTMYEYTGTFRDYLCNTGFYLDKAIGMSTRLHGEFHPSTAALSYAATSFRLNNITIDEETAADARTINDFMSIYYPRRSSEGRLVRLLKASADFQSSHGPGLSQQEVDEILEICKISYGDSSSYYLNQLAQIVNFFIFSHPDYASFLDFFNSECERIFPDSLTSTLWKVYVNSNVKYVNGEDGARRMNILRDDYLANHRPSPLSVYLGQQLAGFFQNIAYDLDSAIKVYEALSQDASGYYGNPSPLYFMAQKNLFGVTATGNDPAEIRILDEIISEARKGSYKGKDRTIRDLLLAKADYHWGTAHYSEAANAYHEILPLYKTNEESLPARVREAICISLSGGNSAYAAKQMKKAIEEIDRIPAKEAPPRLLIEAASFFSVTNDLEKAVSLLERALDAHNYQTNFGLDDEYFDISGELAVLYEETNNRTAASRLIANDRDALKNAMTLAPTYTMVNYLLNSYYRALQRQDWNSTYFYLGAAFNAVQAMSTSSGGSDVVTHNLGVACCQAFTSLFVELQRQLRMAEDYLNSEEFSKYRSNFDQAMQMFADAMPEVKNGMDKMEKSFPEFDPNFRDNPRYQTLLSSQGAYYQAYEKNYPKAEEYLLKALELCRTPVDRKNTLLNLVGLMEIAGDSTKQQTYLSKAYDVISGNPQSMTFNDRLGEKAFHFNKALTAHEIAEASSLAREIYKENRKLLDGNFQLMSSFDQQQILNLYGDPAWALAALLDSDPHKLAPEVYDAVVYRTGMQLRSQQQTRHIIQNSNNPDIYIIADSIAGIRAQLKQINITPDQWLTEEGLQVNRVQTDLNFRLERLEQELLDLTAKERSEADPEVTWQMIRDALRPGEAAVEYVLSHNNIMALVVTPGCTVPAAVTLAPWQKLSDSLNSLNAKNSATLAKRLYRPDSKVDLYGMLWQPLEQTLKGVKTIYFNAPGMLHTIAFNAIPTPDGDFLIDRYDLHQLTTTAQLTFPADETAPSSALLVGDVVFHPSQANSSSIPQESGERAVEDDYSLNDFDSRGIARQHFRYLPFTGNELKEISSTFGKDNIRETSRLEATEKNFRELCANSPEVIHLATHGFFLASETEAMRVPFMMRYSSQIGSPMQRSGVALANAEASWTGAEELPEDNDGILTASEVASLNLKGTRLVTLSACETALGGYNFEGIHGLTRGFKQAGAKSLMVSLWSVNDRSTSIFMTEFYRQWLATGNRHRAMRSAVAAVRTAYPSPFYWAPFILLD